MSGASGTEHITERLTAYDDVARRLTYAAEAGLARYVLTAHSTWRPAPRLFLVSAHRRGRGPATWLSGYPQAGHVKGGQMLLARRWEGRPMVPPPTASARSIAEQVVKRPREQLGPLRTTGYAFQAEAEEVGVFSSNGSPFVERRF